MISKLHCFTEKNTKFNDLEVGKKYKVAGVKVFESEAGRHYISFKIDDNLYLTLSSLPSQHTSKILLNIKNNKQIFIIYNGRKEGDQMDFSYCFSD